MNGLTKLYNIRRIELAYSYSTISGIGKEILDIIEEIVKILQKEKIGLLDPQQVAHPLQAHDDMLKRKQPCRKDL